ncbi:MAG: DM13 domain-containing protein [Cocleimonas sp.]
MKKILLLISHLIFAAIGFAVGIYALPILTAPEAPSKTEMEVATAEAAYKGEFKKDLAGSDFFHWGEGTVSIGERFISLDGEITPGPDYKLYLSPKFVETEAEFNQAKANMVRVGDVKTFENFVIPVGAGIDPEKYNTVVIWCEAFGEFITAAKYK